MISLGTILIAAVTGDPWTAVSDVLTERNRYRVLVARSDRLAHATLAETEVDLVIAEDDGKGWGLGLLADLRVSHPDVVRVLVLDKDAKMPTRAILPSAIYELVRKPPDPERVRLVVERGLRARELSRRDRLLSPTFGPSSELPVRRALHASDRAPESQRFERILGISAGVLDKLETFDFPGNVRKLENEIRRAATLTPDRADLPAHRHTGDAPARDDLPDRFVPRGETLKQRVEDLERHMVSETLARHRWNQSRAADELGLSRVGLANKIRRYRLG